MIDKEIISINRNNIELCYANNRLDFKYNDMVSHSRSYIITYEDNARKIKSLEHGLKFPNDNTMVLKEGFSPNVTMVNEIYSFLNEKKVKKNHQLIIIGDGPLIKTAGYAAATYLKGLDCAIVPIGYFALIEQGMVSEFTINLNDELDLLGIRYSPNKVVFDFRLMGKIKDLILLSLKYALFYNMELFDFIYENQRLLKKNEMEDILPIFKKTLEMRIKSGKKDHHLFLGNHLYYSLKKFVSPDDHEEMKILSCILYRLVYYLKSYQVVDNEFYEKWKNLYEFFQLQKSLPVLEKEGERVLDEVIRSVNMKKNNWTMIKKPGIGVRDAVLSFEEIRKLVLMD